MEFRRVLGRGRAKRYDLTGGRFGKLVAVHEVGKLRRNYHWYCRCDCGGDAIVKVQSLTTGRTQSCGCLQPEAVRAAATTHGMSRRGEHAIWLAIRHRCNNQKHKQYKDYGGRGIKVAKEWDCPGGFPSFFAHIGPRPTPRHTIERVNNDRGYVPGNVRWATRSDQARNTRRTRLITFRGSTKCLTDWARYFGMKPNVAYTRIYNGWPFHKAMTWPVHVPKPKKPVLKKRQYVEVFGEKKTISQWAKRFSISQNAVAARLKKGWSVEKSLTTPRAGVRLLTFRGETLSPSQWSKRTGLGTTTILYRIKKGWAVEKALTTPLLRVREGCHQLRPRSA